MKNKNSNINKGGLVFLFICCALYLGYAYMDKPICAEKGCNNIREEGSQYCVLHNPENKSSLKNTNVLETTTESNTSTVKIITTEKITETTTIKTNSDYTYKNNNSYNNSYNNSNSSSYNNNSYKYSTPKSYNSSSKKLDSGADSYEEGYHSAYDEDYYDYDRYEYDSDYASGVEHALDDLEYEYYEYYKNRK